MLYYEERFKAKRSICIIDSGEIHADICVNLIMLALHDKWEQKEYSRYFKGLLRSTTLKQTLNTLVMETVKVV